MKNKKLNLPRGYLSYTQLIMWEKQPKKYKERYFFGGQTFTNKEMRFGKRFSDALDGKQVNSDESLEMVKLATPKYDVAEKKLTATLKIDGYEIKLLGFIDSWQKRTYNFREYKTGKTPWTQNKVDKFEQITFYALLSYLNINKIPKKMFLDWIETQNDGNGGIEFNGHIKSFQTNRS